MTWRSFEHDDPRLQAGAYIVLDERHLYHVIDRSVDRLMVVHCMSDKELLVSLRLPDVARSRLVKEAPSQAPVAEVA